MGKRIVELRHRKEMTQEQLGKQLNVSGQAVSKWENGDSLPDITLLAGISQSLDCTTDFLLGADKVGDVNRLIPSMESRLRELKPSQKIDLAFKIFNLIDEISEVNVSSSLKSNSVEERLPFVHAGPEGVTLWWEGKFFCNVSIEALRETENVWNDEHLPFDLFRTEWNSVITALLAQKKNFFNSDAAITETSLQQDSSLDTRFDIAVNELIDSGIIEKGKGGYRVGIKAEVLLRLLGVLLHSIGKPGVISQACLPHSNIDQVES
ncbi:helix-turn-helix domain-containing protein [Paenibacillus castaneae]|nr:helix-turn-helix transcriptional regulator [Paenibacillus castaneae]